MGTQRDHPTEITAERTESRHDTGAAAYETQPAGLRVTTGESGDVEEFV